jgi:hypothetical protein
LLLINQIPDENDTWADLLHIHKSSESPSYPPKYWFFLALNWPD